MPAELLERLFVVRQPILEELMKRVKALGHTLVLIIHSLSDPEAQENTPHFIGLSPIQEPC